MGRGLQDVSPQLPTVTYHNTTAHSPHSSSSSSSSSSSFTVMIIVLSSVLILSICLYLLLRCLSANQPRAAAAPGRLKKSLDSNISLPLFKFSSLATNNIEAADCAICLASFDPTDQLRLLPLCCHAFHAHCIDTWLSSSHDTCPLCRSTVYPTEDDVLNKTLPSLSRGNSYRIEIGSLSQRRNNIDQGLERSYSIGPFEYVVGDSYEVSVGTCREKEEVVGDGLGGGDVAGRSWLMDYVDRLGSYSRTFSYRNSGRFWNGSVRRSESVGRVEDLEANRFGEEISEIFRWLSGV